MRIHLPLLLALGLTAATIVPAADYHAPRSKAYDFPIYTNNPPGKQLVGDTVRAAASTPALSPEETRKLIQVPPGFEVRLFASEPMVVNPVAMTWDERGRLWVLELYEYPKGAPKGEKGRDRVKILEDTDGDGVADKATVFADGFSLAEGMILGNGGVYVGAPPNLYFLKDTDGDDKADTREIVLTGFGNEDRHELLNGFAWGPDGWLYMTHGVFTHSKVKDPNNPNDDGVTMNAALARFHPVTKKFEVFADGTSNPWGVDWNERGDAFVSACVIQHLFHMAPGGQYNRQGGTWANPYGYVQDLPTKGLPAIVDFRHYRAAHAGITVYQGDQWPAEWRGLVFLGNIHASSLNCDRLTPVGATYKAEKESTLLGPASEALLKKSGEKIPKGEEWKFVGPGTFLVSRDPWFRPVSNQTGPDGALWVMDWYDKYPCYQNAQADPDGVDREYGRIWRVVWTGDQPGKPVPSRPSKEMDLKKLKHFQLAQLLDHPNVWQRRQAARLLTETPATGPRRLDLAAGKLVEQTFQSAKSLDARIGALSTAPRYELDLKILSQLARKDSSADVRASAVRVMGNYDTEKSDSPQKVQWDLVFIADVLDASRDSDSRVRSAAATVLRQWTSGSLTVNTKPRLSVNDDRVLPHFRELLARPSVVGDFYYPHIVWMAMEPRAAANPQPFFPLLAANENSVSAYCTRRVMRRICDLSDVTARAQHLNAALEWLGGLSAKTELAGAALDGLIEAQKSKGAPPTLDLAPIFAKLTANPALADKARRLATLLGDTSASKSLLAKINDPKASVEDRLKAIQAARETKTDAARDELLRLLLTEKNQSLLTETVRALNDFSGNQSDAIAYSMVDAWKNFTPPTRRAAAEVLVTRTKWARALLAGVEKKAVDAQDISATARRALAQSSDATIADNADRTLGRYRASNADKLKLIADKRKVVMSGEPDAKAGYEVAKRTCFVCHKLHGEGADVGPDLTGVGRSSLDALLHNIVDPNEVIGKGYEATEVELKDGRTVAGRIVEDTDTRLKLVAAGPIETVVAKSDIALENGKAKIRTTEMSLMPEGLEQISDADFRNLIWYILNPPQDNRAWTPALRRELFGEETKPQKTTQATPPLDMESVALWNPDWKVTCPPFEGAPAKLTEFQGRKNVLMTHPVERNKPSSLERVLELPIGKTALSFYVAAHDEGDWELRVFANNELIHKQLVNRNGEAWKKVSVDLSRFAGKRVSLRLENAANDWKFEFGYWSNIEIKSAE